jgi:hypothetical protein
VTIIRCREQLEKTAAEGEVLDAYESGIGSQVVVAVRIEGTDQTLTVTFSADLVELTELD